MRAWRGLAELVALLGTNDEDLKVMRWLGDSKNRNLAPELFDVWPLFREAKIEALAIRRLQAACNSLSLPPPQYWAVRLFSPEDDRMWWTSVAKHPDLCKKAADYLFRYGLEAWQAVDVIAKNYLRRTDFIQRLEKQVAFEMKKWRMP